MRFAFLLIAALTGATLLAGDADAQRSPEWQSCTGNSDVDWDRQIEGCTALIASGLEAAHDRSVAYYNRGNAYNAKGDLDRAIADFSEAIRFEPTDADSRYNRGIAYRDKGDLDRAIADLTESIRLDPKFDAYDNRGLAYLIKGDLDRAIADLDEAVRLDPKDLDAYDNRSMAYREKGDPDRAIADTTEALRLDPTFTKFYGTRGIAYFDKGELDRASADFSEVIRLDPKNTYAYVNRGIVNVYAGALAAARADFDQGGAVNRDDAPYAALWLDIVAHRSNTPSALSQAIATLDMTAWPAPVLRLFLGQMPLAAVLAAADDPDAAKKKGQVCEANFYGAEWLLQTGAKDEAARLLQAAVADCPKRFREWQAAGAELKALAAAR